MTSRDLFFQSAHAGGEHGLTDRIHHESLTTLPPTNTPVVPTNGTWPETTADSAGFIPLGKGENISIARELAPVARLPRFLEPFHMSHSFDHAGDGPIVRCELFPIKVDKEGRVHYGPPMAKYLFCQGFLNGAADTDARMAYALFKVGVLKPGDRQKYEREIQQHRSDQEHPEPGF